METLQIENCQKTSYIYIYIKWPEYILFQCWTPRLGLIVWTIALRTTVSGHSALLTLNCWCDAAARGYCLHCQPLHRCLRHYFINISSSLVNVLKDSNKNVLEFGEICIWKGKTIQNLRQQTMKRWWRREQLSIKVYSENRLYINTHICML